MHDKIGQYLTIWQHQGYSDAIPDVVLDDVMHERLAPSYKAIALAILKHDHGLQSLGFAAPESRWYVTLKQIELQHRTGTQQMLPYDPAQCLKIYFTCPSFSA